MALQVEEAESSEGAEFVHLERLDLGVAGFERFDVVEVRSDMDRDPLVPHTAVGLYPSGRLSAHNARV